VLRCTQCIFETINLQWWRCFEVVQGDRKVMQPILKYLLMVAIQYSSVGLITQYRCDLQEPAPWCNLLAPVRQLSSNSRSARMSFSQVQQVFIVEHYLASCSYLTCQNEFRDTVPVLLCQTNWQYLIWWTISVTQEACRTQTVPFDLQC
jgi:hypothetical protein